MTETVLDASALLAVIGDEPGCGPVVEALRRGACGVSAVNLSEVVAKLTDRGAQPGEIREGLDAFGLEVHVFDGEQAHQAGLLRAATRAAGLSLGDRACLGLAANLGVPVFTADRSWAGLGLPVEVLVLRGG